MRLVRNTTQDISCKYVFLRLDKMREDGIDPIAFINILGILSKYVDLGLPGQEDEFFAIKMKDINSRHALEEYANSAMSNGDYELANDVRDLSYRSGFSSPYCHNPD